MPKVKEKLKNRRKYGFSKNPIAGQSHQFNVYHTYLMTLNQKISTL
jgi:hypothetical protein